MIQFPMELDLGPLAPHNIWEIIIGAILLVLIGIGYSKFVGPKVEAAYQERAARIQGGLERAEKAQAEAAQAKRKYEQQVLNAESDAAKIRDEARANAARILAESREQAKAESRRMIEEAKQQIQAERAEVIRSLRAEVGGFAVDLASRIVGESLQDDQRAKRTIDHFLDDLAKEPEKTLHLEADRI